MLVGECTNKAHEIEVRKINGNYTIFTDGVLTQRDLTPDAFVRWACNALEDGSTRANKTREGG